MSMPCNKEHRKIVSKSHQRALFAKAGRGEISKKKVVAMAERTKKSKGSLKNLPEKTASIQSVVNFVSKVASEKNISKNIGKLFGWIKQLGINKKSSVNKTAFRVTKITSITKRLAGRIKERDWIMNNVRIPVNLAKKKELVNKAVKQVVKKNGESLPQATWPLDSAPVKPYTSENYKFSNVRNVINRIYKVALSINPGNDAMKTMMNKSMSLIKDSMKPMATPKPTTTIMNKPNKSPFDKSSSVNKFAGSMNAIRNIGVNKTSGEKWNKIKSLPGKAIDKITDYIGGAKAPAVEPPKPTATPKIPTPKAPPVPKPQGTISTVKSHNAALEESLKY